MDQTKRRVGPLRSLRDVRAQMARLFREWRRGQIGNDDLRAGVCCLRELRDVIMAAEIEPRLQKLEQGEWE